jgi:hypothetical protein
MYCIYELKQLKMFLKMHLFSEPVVGLDPKYFEHSTPGGTLTRLQIPDVNSLPSNVRRPAAGGGLVRRTLDSVPDIL